MASIDPTDPQRTYDVADVGGHRPTDLDDIVGATTIGLHTDDGEALLRGTGTKVGGRVLFHDRELDSAHDDGPTWTITAEGSPLLAHQPTDD